MKIAIRHILLFILLALLLPSCGYHKLGSHQEEVFKAWSDMENEGQRRIDLARHVVDTYIKDDISNKELLTQIKESRANAELLSMEMTPGNLGQDYVTRYQEAQNQLKSDLNKYFGVMKSREWQKNDPDAVAFRDESKQIDDSLNKHILLYNTAALRYNTTRKHFWNSFTASMARFRPKGYFKDLPITK